MDDFAPKIWIIKKKNVLYSVIINNKYCGLNPAFPDTLKNQTDLCHFYLCLEYRLTKMRDVEWVLADWGRKWSLKMFALRFFDQLIGRFIVESSLPVLTHRSFKWIHNRKITLLAKQREWIVTAGYQISNRYTTQHENSLSQQPTKWHHWSNVLIFFAPRHRHLKGPQIKGKCHDIQVLRWQLIKRKVS